MLSKIITGFRWFALACGYALLMYFIMNTNVKAETITVTASAYNTVPAQTSGNPNIGACGKLSAKNPSIAVSRNLRKKLPCNSKVKIEGKVYTVRDTMPPRWHNKIDICYFKDVKSARKFGVRKIKMEIM